VKQLIKKILREHTEKNLSSVIDDFLKTTIKSHEDIVCKIDILSPTEREKKSGTLNYKYKSYMITVTFVGGYESKRWPRTQTHRIEEANILNEIEKNVEDFFGITCHMYSKTVKDCDKKNKDEESEGVGAYAAPAFEMMPDHEHFKHQYNGEEINERCWKGYTQKGMKTMFGKRYPNCVKIKK
jgi:hypothetical protein